MIFSSCVFSFVQLSTARVLCESCPAHQVLVFRSLVVASAHLVHETVCS